MAHKEIGKIDSIEFGYGGYQGVMLGFSISFSGEGWGSGTFLGVWASDPSTSAQWTKKDRDLSLAGHCFEIKKLMNDAKVQSLSQLQGKPVEVTFESPIGKIISYRILTEVL